LIIHDVERDRYAARVARLIFERQMTARAARTVIDAAMYGKGCVEGTVRAKIQLELTKNGENHG
jgi:hypothetical protein